MSPKRNEVRGAMFDVRPAGDSGSFSVAEKELPEEINLRVTVKRTNSARIHQKPTPKEESFVVPESDAPHPNPPARMLLTKLQLQRDLEALFASDEGGFHPPVRIGSTTQRGDGSPLSVPPRGSTIPTPRTGATPDHERVIHELRRPLPPSEEHASTGIEPPLMEPDSISPSMPVSGSTRPTELEQAITSVQLASLEASSKETKELEAWWGEDAGSVPAGVTLYPPTRIVAPVYTASAPEEIQTLPTERSEYIHRSPWTLVWMFIGALVVISGLLAFSRYGAGIKARIVRNGEVAVENLEAARQNLERFDFSGAEGNFLLAYEQFSDVEHTINFFGGVVSDIAAKLPGGKQIGSAKQLVEAGSLIAQAGQKLSGALTVLGETGQILDSNGNTRALLSDVLRPLSQAFEDAERDIKAAEALLADVDPETLPDESRESFLEFQDAMPSMVGLLADGVAYTKFLEQFVSVQGSAKYLILFQNSSELRPTGGFPGTYAVVTFRQGRMEELFVDDVYNLDGQRAEDVVPPRELQHITPTWGMRDVSWFVDFPTSARKVMEYYTRTSGTSVDGVLTMTPEVFGRIIGALGSVALSDYGVELTEENFLAELQHEVEYGENRALNKPKQIIVDAAPIVLERLESAPPSTWLKIVDVFLGAVARKDILLYFTDPGLQQFVLSRNMGGAVVSTPSDYIMVTFSNIKGAKADAVTDTSLHIHTSFGDDALRHTLTITRDHQGDESTYGFYNRENPSYVRVLVPNGSTLEHISGNAQPSYKPLVSYASSDFVQDADLGAFEKSGSTDPQTGVTIYTESGKTEFGFWMIVQPGQTSTVTLEYSVPPTHLTSNYQLYIQKQPGLVVKDLELTVEDSGNFRLQSSDPVFTRTDSTYRARGELTHDLPVRITLQ